MMRDINPFSFFYNHASAIEGLGGDARSPDPRYCFHTPYVEVRPGLAWFELKLNGVRASRGELALRVHAFRPESGENASLAAAGRLNVWIDEKQDLEIKVRFGAIRGVQYAFYGHFLEDGDIRADGVSVTLVEPEGEEVVYLEPPRSELAMREERLEVKREVRPANALIHYGSARLHVPVSQDFTLRQAADIGRFPDFNSARRLWGEALCLAAVRAYGVAGNGLEGQLIGEVSPEFRQELLSVGLALRGMEEEPRAEDVAIFADFMLWPRGAPLDPEPEGRWKRVRTWLARLKIGGLAVIPLRYQHSLDPLNSASAVEGEHLTRNEIGKWVLRLIGEGYSVAPMAFAPAGELVVDEDGLAAFSLIVQRG